MKRSGWGALAAYGALAAVSLAPVGACVSSNRTLAIPEDAGSPIGEDATLPGQDASPAPGTDAAADAGQDSEAPEAAASQVDASDAGGAVDAGDATTLEDAGVDGATPDASDARAPDAATDAAVDASPQTEAGSDAGGVSAACTTCMSTSCSGAYPTCEGDPDCPPILTCWADSYTSAPPPDESATCPTGHTTGISQAFLLGDCAARSCASTCPWAQALPACWECLFMNASTDSNACWVDQSCVDYVDCVILCGTDLTCFNGCGSGDGAAQAELNDVQGTCSASCPVL